MESAENENSIRLLNVMHFWALTETQQFFYI